MNPLLIYALLTAASTGANTLGQRDEDKARARVMAEDRARRTAAEQRNAAASQSTSALLADTAADQGKRATEIEQRYTGAHAAAPQPGTPAMSDVVAPSGATQTVNTPDVLGDRARAFVANQAKQRGILESYGDVMLGNKIAANRNAQDIDRANTGVQNWTQYVLPKQLQVANMAGRKWNTVGDMLQLAATIYGPHALSKAPGADLTSAFDVSTAAPGAAGFMPGEWDWMKQMPTGPFGAAQTGVYPV